MKATRFRADATRQSSERTDANPIVSLRFATPGDIVHADADGHFFIVDRLKELIEYKGMQIPPAE